MTTDTISPDLKTTLRRLKLSRMLDTLPERLVLARQQKMPHQDLLLLVLSDEVTGGTWPSSSIRFNRWTSSISTARAIVQASLTRAAP